jgi:menaquinol-cytochrome c reductase iron-sulfur subunit
MSQSPHISRNEFVKLTVGLLGSIIGLVIGLPAIGYVLAPALKKQEVDAWIPLGNLVDFPISEPTVRTFTRTNENGWERTVNSYGVFILRNSEAENDVAVLSNVCTHLSCRVNWSDDLKEYVCPCHDGRFDSQGKVISGPAPRPLDRYNETRVENGILSVHFVEG